MDSGFLRSEPCPHSAVQLVCCRRMKCVSCSCSHISISVGTSRCSLMGQSCGFMKYTFPVILYPCSLWVLDVGSKERLSFFAIKQRCCNEPECTCNLFLQSP